MENKGITELSKEWQDILTKGCNMFKFSAKEKNKNGNERL